MPASLTTLHADRQLWLLARLHAILLRHSVEIVGGMSQPESDGGLDVTVRLQGGQEGHFLFAAFEDENENDEEGKTRRHCMARLIPEGC
jgi:hypothetical protein